MNTFVILPHSVRTNKAEKRCAINFAGRAEARSRPEKFQRDIDGEERERELRSKISAVNEFKGKLTVVSRLTHPPAAFRTPGDTIGRLAHIFHENSKSILIGESFEH